MGALKDALTLLQSDVTFNGQGLADFMDSYIEVAVKLLAKRVKLHKELLQAREKLRVPKDKDLTDFDRRTMNEAYCAEVQEKYEMIKGLEELLKDKMELVKMIGSL